MSSMLISPVPVTDISKEDVVPPAVTPTAPPPTQNAEFADLKQENERLRQQLRLFVEKLADQSSSSDSKIPDSQGVHVLDITNESDPELLDLYQSLRQDLQATVALDQKNRGSSNTLASDSSPSDPLRPGSGTPGGLEETSVLKSMSKRRVVVVNQAQGRDDEACVVDLSDQEWWTLVGTEGEDDFFDNEGESYEDCHLEGEEDDAFVVLQDDDMIEAVGKFVVASMNDYPAASDLTPEQLRRMLDGSFQTLRSPTKFEKAISWGQFAYNTVSWGSCFFRVYQNPTYVKLVATGAYKAARWIIILLV
jgi:hypothetical protein